MEILNDLHKKEGKTLIVVTHDASIGRKAQKQIILKDGKIVSGKKATTQL